MKKRTTLYYALIAMISGLSVLFTSCDEESSTVFANWEDTSESFPGVPRAGAVSFKLVVDGQERVYVGTGINTTRTPGTENFRDFYYCYVSNQNPDPKEYVYSTKWSNPLGVAPMPEEAGGRNGAVAFSLNGKGYVGLGRNNEGWHNDFWCFDPAGTWTDDKGMVYEGSWSRVASPQTGSLKYAISFVMKDPKDGKEYAYVGTGEDEEGNSTCKFYRFDGETWSEEKDCITPRKYASAVVANGYASGERTAGEPAVHDYAYLIGGCAADDEIKVERYNPYTHSWEKSLLGSLKADRNMFASASFVLGDSENDADCKQRIYIITGGLYSASNKMWEFNPYTESWKELGTARDINCCRYATAWTLHYGPNREERALISLGCDSQLVEGVFGSFFTGTYMYFPK